MCNMCSLDSRLQNRTVAITQKKCVCEKNICECGGVANHTPTVIEVPYKERRRHNSFGDVAISTNLAPFSIHFSKKKKKLKSRNTELLVDMLQAR